MSWAVGYDENWKRDIGYGVPAVCDHPGCGEEIDRGLAYVCCGEQPYGGDGCGLFFCEKHLVVWAECQSADDEDEKVEHFCCERCGAGKEPFEPTPDVEEWTAWKMTHVSWAAWRKENGHPEPAVLNTEGE